MPTPRRFISAIKTTTRIQTNLHLHKSRRSASSFSKTNSTTSSLASYITLPALYPPPWTVAAFASMRTKTRWSGLTLSGPKPQATNSPKMATYRFYHPAGHTARIKAASEEEAPPQASQITDPNIRLPLNGAWELKPRKHRKQHSQNRNTLKPNSHQYETISPATTCAWPDSGLFTLEPAQQG